MDHPAHTRLTLISHHLCPYVQRAAIVLLEKNIPFERRYVDLANKPEWFKQLSPLGKTPVLLVDGTPIFESAVICEYLDETTLPRLHPVAPLARAQHRAWMEFGSAILNTIWGFYMAPDQTTFTAKREELEEKFQQVETVLAQGPFFAGADFCVVDAVFAPIFRYFDVFDQMQDFGILAQAPKVRAWRAILAEQASVKAAVTLDYSSRLLAFFQAKDSVLGKLSHQNDSLAS